MLVVIIKMFSKNLAVSYDAQIRNDFRCLDGFLWALWV